MATQPLSYIRRQTRTRSARYSSSVLLMSFLKFYQAELVRSLQWSGGKAPYVPELPGLHQYKRSRMPLLRSSGRPARNRLARGADRALVHAAGQYDEALKTLSAAASAEDRTEKHPVTPGPLAPVRELLGFMLLDRGMAKEALEAFEATLRKEPNRLGAYSGAAKAAEKSGDSTKARMYYAKVVELAADAGTTRPDVSEARAFVARTQ